MSAVVVLGHPEDYPRFGFPPASLSGIRLSIDVPDEALTALRLGVATLPAGLVALIRPVRPLTTTVDTSTRYQY